MNRIPSSRSLPRFLMGLAFLGLGSCLSVSAERMVPEELDLGNPIAGDVEVVVLAGTESTFGYIEEVPMEEFQPAIELAILKFGVFGGLATEGAAYRLETTLYPINALASETFFGIHYEVAANWRLVRQSDGAVLVQQQVKTDHEGTFSDAFAGGNRMVLTTEGASRKNIQEALELISRLSL